MEAACAVTCLTTDVDLVKRRRVSHLRHDEVLFKVRGMALSAHVVPILSRTSPVQWVLGAELLIHVGRFEIKPRILCRVPTHPQNLDSADRINLSRTRRLNLDHVLLKRIDAKDVFDFEVLKRTVWPLRIYHEFFAVTKHGCRDAKVFDLLIIKVAEHRGICRQIHRQIVMRARPILKLLGVAFGATILADIATLYVRGIGPEPIDDEPGERECDAKSDQNGQSRYAAT